MFKKAECAALAEFDLCAVGPVIVSSGNNNELDPRLADSVFMTGSNGTKDAFVIPGSTLKGITRSYVNEFFSRVEKELFGFSSSERKQKGKISFSDAYADMSTIKTAKIFSTAIHPILQSAKGTALNNLQAVVEGVFKARFEIKNYTKDELVAVLSALYALNNGELRIGGRTSRGFGVMKVENFKMTLYGGYNSDTLERKVIAAYDSFDDCVKEVCANV